MKKTKKQIIQELKNKVLKEIEKERLTIAEINLIIHSLEMIWIDVAIEDYKDDKEHYKHLKEQKTKAEKIVKKLNEWYKKNK